MQRRRFGRFFVLGLGSLLLASQAVAQPGVQPRRLAPGILTEIPPAIEEGETFTGPVPLKHLPTVDFTPNYASKEQTLFEKSKLVTFRRPITELEFAFKPLRMVTASIPQASGKLLRKPILYMVYRIRNNGKALRQVEQTDGTFKSEEVSIASLSGHPTAQRFFPRFVLVGWIYNEQTRKYEQQEYLDRIIPGALRTIQDREILPPAKPLLMDQGGKPVLGPDGQPLILLNTAQISQVDPIPVTTDTDDNSVWGVVTWEELDPRIDYLTIYIQGLTNAFEYTESVDGKPHYAQKTLQLNWWRPGDDFDEVNDKIYYGVPLVKDQRKQVEILNFYQVPGPSLTVSETIEVAAKPAVIPGAPATGEMTNLTRLLFDLPVSVNSKLQVPSQLQLDAGELPTVVQQKFLEAGINIPASVGITQESPRSIWSLATTIDGRKRFFRIQYEPQYWDLFQDQVEFRERVEYLWVYR